MALVRTFEDLQAWQKARLLSSRIYAVTRLRPWYQDRDLAIQIRRAGVSVMSNIAEGFERGRPREFAHFLSIAKGSAGEIVAQLYVAMDSGYLSDEQFEELKALAKEVGRIIGGLSASLAARSTRKT